MDKSVKHMSKMASVHKLFCLALVLSYMDNYVMCNPVHVQSESEQPLSRLLSQELFHHSTGHEAPDAAQFSRPTTQYQRDIFETMRSQDNYPSLRTTDVNIVNRRPAETVVFLRPLFGLFGRRLYFNISAIPVDVNITHAEVVFSSANSTRLADDIHISVPVNDTTTALRVRSTTSAYVVDVSDIVRTEKASSQATLMVNVRLQRHNASWLWSRDGRIQRLQPMLAVFENINTEQLLRSYTDRTRRSSDYTENEIVRNDPTRDAATTRAPGVPDFCRVANWDMNFSYIGWNWVLLPTTYQANVCIGSCPLNLFESDINSTIYASIKSLYHLVSNYTSTSQVPRACCTPTEYAHQSIMYYDNTHHGHIIERVEQMKVVACGCR